MLLDTRYNKITERIIGSAMRVHTVLGTGFQEVIISVASLLKWSGKAWFLGVS
jgi:hypothetical protein